MLSHIEPGDIVIVPFRNFQTDDGIKNRPAIAVASDSAGCVTVAPITSNVSRSHYSDQMIIDPDECPESGLRRAGVIKFNQLMTFDVSRIRDIGRVSDDFFAAAMSQLRSVLAL